MTISLITVCYQSADVLGTAMESVLRQTWPDIEYLVVDGGSTDGTMDVIREYELKFCGRMRWISERDCGMYDAINKGIRMATGEVIGILNADDVLATDNTIMNVVTAFMGEPSVLDAVYGDVRFVANKKTLTLDALKQEKTIRYYSSKYFRTWLARFGYLPAHPSFYCRRLMFEKFGVYRIDYKIAADHELMIRFFVKEKLTSRYVPDVFAVMRVGGMSTRSLESTLVLNRENIRACRANGIYTSRLLQLGKYLFKIPGVVFKNGY